MMNDAQSQQQQQQRPTEQQQQPSSRRAVVGLHYDVTIDNSNNSINNNNNHNNHNNDDAEVLLRLARNDGYDFITCRIPILSSSSSSSSSHVISSSTTSRVRTDITNLESKWWRTSIVGVLDVTTPVSVTSASTCTSVTTAATTTVTNDILMILKERLQSSIEWCIHMNLPAIILPSLPSIILSSSSSSSSVSSSLTSIKKQIALYANIVLSCIVTTNIRDLQIWIPFSIPISTTSTTSNSNNHHHDLHNLLYFYQILDYHPSIHTLITFDTTVTTPKNSMINTMTNIIQQIHVMIGTVPPIAAIQVYTHVFLHNKRGYPTLSRIHQMILILFYRRLGGQLNHINTNSNNYNIKLLITQTKNEHDHIQLYTRNSISSDQLGFTKLLPHLQYIQHFCQNKIYVNHNTTNTTSTTTIALQNIHNLEMEYNDVLQSPLQPLMDHLENYTYEIFEYDPIKYQQYELSIYYTMYHDYYYKNRNNNNYSNVHNHSTLQQGPVQETLHSSTIPQPMDCTISIGTKGTTFTGLSSLTSNPIMNQNNLIDDITTTTNDNNTNMNNVISPYIVLVVGAGRGPLVTCTIKAYEKLQMEIKSQHNNNSIKNNKMQQRQLHVYAIEKNPNAILYLKSKFASYLVNTTTTVSSSSSSTIINSLNYDDTLPAIRLHIVQSDLRYLNANELFHDIITATTTTSNTILNADRNNDNPMPPPPTTIIKSRSIQPKANIIVSELLGSFGCNELSPECLDALIQNHTNGICDENTISIPCKYTSHIAPVSSMKLYHKVKQQALYPIVMDNTSMQTIGLLKAMETPYVVRPYVASQIYNTQDCWSFTHTPIIPKQNIDVSLPSVANTATPSSSAINHERYVHLEFPSTSDMNSNDTLSSSSFMYGALYGSGYGPTDEYIQNTLHAVLESNQKNHISSSTSTTASTVSTDAAVTTTQHVTNVLDQHNHSIPWICTGLLGTFTADLYHPMMTTKGITNTDCIQISTNPSKYSTGMFSWFPLYFPSIQPITIPINGILHVDIWRKCSKTKVWYEWLFTVVVPTTITATSTVPSEGNVSASNDTTTTATMEMDEGNNTININKDQQSQQEPEYDVIYVSPIHNPGGRSSYVSLI